MDSLIFLDSTYYQYDGATLFFNLHTETGEEISSFLFSPHPQSNNQSVRYLSHDYQNDKVLIGIESLSSQAEFFGYTLGHLQESHIYFLEVDMNFLVSTDEITLDHSLVGVYPNPVSSLGSLILKTKSGEEGNFRLMDTQGRVIAHGTKTQGEYSHTLSLTDTAEGAYIFQYQEGNKVQNQIVIIE